MNDKSHFLSLRKILYLYWHIIGWLVREEDKLLNFNEIPRKRQVGFRISVAWSKKSKRSNHVGAYKYQFDKWLLLLSKKVETFCGYISKRTRFPKETLHITFPSTSFTLLNNFLPVPTFNSLNPSSTSILVAANCDGCTETVVLISTTFLIHSPYITLSPS